MEPVKIKRYGVQCSFCHSSFVFAEADIGPGDTTLAIRVNINGEQVCLQSQFGGAVFRCFKCRSERRETTLDQEKMMTYVYKEDLTEEMIAEYRKKLAVRVAEHAATGIRNDFYRS